MTDVTLPGTPFHERTSALNRAQQWRRWAGHIVASGYELTHEREYHAIRSAAAVIDVSPLYKYDVQGPDAARLLDRVVTRDVTRCAVGQVLYTPWCDARGKVLDDGTLQRLAEQHFRLTAAEPNMRWLQDNAIGLDVAIADVSARIAALAIQGPAARAVLAGITDADLDGLRFFRLTNGTVAGIAATISRTGYTGDLGYELWVDAADAVRLWDAVLARGESYGVIPAGILALDMARVEAGLILLDVDYVPARKAVIESRKSSPLELGLGWTVALDKPYFVGCEALRAEAAREPAWQLHGLAVEWESLERAFAEFALPPQVSPVAWRTSVPVYDHGSQVGYATSGCFSPLLKQSIALAHLESRVARLGTELEIEVTVEHRRRRAAARVVALPFFDPERKRV
ncbi:MAG TPA: aminomethyltransferase family protein [Gemmatimonadales bacterium]|jgi:aminomethyltransferase